MRGGTVTHLNFDDAVTPAHRSPSRVDRCAQSLREWTERILSDGRCPLERTIRAGDVHLLTHGSLEKQRFVPTLAFPPWKRVYGFRTDVRAEPLLAVRVAPRRVVPLELALEAHYHGDTVLCAFGPGARLARYVSRPPVSVERLTLTAQGQVRYRLKTPCRDGSTHIVLEPVDFIARLAALVPPPRAHLTRFHGVFAPHAALRAAVTPAGRGPGAHRRAGKPAKHAKSSRETVALSRFPGPAPQAYIPGSRFFQVQGVFTWLLLISMAKASKSTSIRTCRCSGLSATTCC